MRTRSEDRTIDGRQTVVAQPCMGGVDDVLRDSCPMVASYGERDRLVAAADAWQRIEAFFAENLGS